MDIPGLVLLLLPELDGRQHPGPDVFALQAEVHSNGVDHVLTHFIAGTVDYTTYPLSLQKIEETLGSALSWQLARRLIEWISSPVFWLASPNSHKQSL